MAIRVRVVVSPNWFEIAIVRKHDIKFKGRSLYPIAIHQLQASDGSASGTVGGAIIGGVLAGGVGALVGAIAGRGGRTVFVIETREGQKLVCTCKSSEFAGIYVVVNRIMESAPPVPAVQRATRQGQMGFSWPYAIIFGPLYLARYGFLPFLAGVTLVGVSYGTLWPFLAMLSSYLDQRAVKRLS